MRPFAELGPVSHSGTIRSLVPGSLTIILIGPPSLSLLVRLTKGLLGAAYCLTLLLPFERAY